MSTAPVEAFTTQGLQVVLSADEVAFAKLKSFGVLEASIEGSKAIVVTASTFIARPDVKVIATGVTPSRWLTPYAG